MPMLPSGWQRVGKDRDSHLFHFMGTRASFTRVTDANLFNGGQAPGGAASRVAGKWPQDDYASFCHGVRKTCKNRKFFSCGEKNLQSGASCIRDSALLFRIVSLCVHGKA